jgi:hypothetical protein
MMPPGLRTSLLAPALCALGTAVVACGPFKIVEPGPSDVPSGGSTGFGELPDAAAGEAGPVRPPAAGEQCADEAVRTELVPLDLLLVLDASGSMNTSIAGRTRWQLVGEALGNFVKDPRSRDLGVGVQTFPFTIHEKACKTQEDCGGASSTGAECARPSLCIGSGVLPATAATCRSTDNCPKGTRCVPSGRCSASSMRCVNLGEICPGAGPNDICEEAPLMCTLPVDSCLAADYGQPKVPIGVLPAATAAITRGLGSIRPAGNTPIAAAIAGATTYLQRHLGERPERRAAIVLATDASPSGCPGDGIDAVAGLLAEAQASSHIPTYVIGVVNTGDATREEAASRLAQAGGTILPFILNDSAADLGTRFLDALNAIRGSALPCELRIPRPSSGQIDPSKVNVRFSGLTGPEDLLYVASADACDPAKGGWYYDVDPAVGSPTTVRVCEATCRRFATEGGGMVELRFGCRSRVE